jgi:hypothetical protein
MTWSSDDMRASFFFRLEGGATCSPLLYSFFFLFLGYGGDTVLYMLCKFPGDRTT